MNMIESLYQLGHEVEDCKLINVNFNIDLNEELKKYVMFSRGEDEGLYIRPGKRVPA